MIIAIDFDGTCVTHDYPRIGKDIGAVPVLKKIVENGHRLLLLTMRSGDKLDEAKKWFEDNEIPIWSANENPEQKSWTESNKVYAHIYIDDAGLGVPLMSASHFSDRPFVNWNEVQKWLINNNIIK
jgi:hypothetical protein